MMVIDLLETSDRALATSSWEAVCAFLSTQPGFRGGQLVETFQTLMPRTDWKLASLCAWDSAEDWERARAAVRSQPDLVSRLNAAGTRFTGFKMNLVDGAEYRFAPSSDRMVLLDIIYLPEERMAAYAAMWAEAARHMAQQPGYLNASLFQNTHLADSIQFINIAEWESAEALFHAVHTDRFMEIVDAFKTDFSLFLTRRILLRTPAPVRALEAATR
ncbi:antibiotic biosynthesis monooxygenase [Corallococcus sp. BB11-1]|uniref:antibiotic biosynthesis monooxygenase family protein n=1 Tax=Corallococcus sp. BB11-1 TaxID=2996783 RepID=UPI00226F8CCB|nr:antibiotic biosynthesis monooxygenase [Corallococcus sp. BB11-1]MCY1035372.1 antibiotic biosynthesis monooxygenase [Corallococcus sp. BB11-1]